IGPDESEVLHARIFIALILASAGVYFIGGRILFGAGWARWASLILQFAIAIFVFGYFAMWIWFDFSARTMSGLKVQPLLVAMIVISGVLLEIFPVYTICRLFSRQAREWFRLAKRFRTGSSAASDSRLHGMA